MRTYSTVSNLFNFLFRSFVFYAEGDGAGGGGSAAGGSGSSGSGGGDVGAQIEAAVKAAVERETAGLKAKNDELLGANKKVKDQLLEFQKTFEGIDPVKTREMFGRFEKDEEGQLLAAGKVDDVINRRTEKMRLSIQTDAEAKVNAALAKVEAAEKRANKFNQRVLDNQLRAAASEVGLHVHAVEDALFRGRSMFSLNDEGDAVQLSQDGSPVLGKDGKTPFSPKEWLESMKTQAPHWFPVQNAGGGAQGNSGKGNNSGKPTISREEYEERVGKGESFATFFRNGGVLAN